MSVLSAARKDILLELVIALVISSRKTEIPSIAGGAMVRES